MLPTHRAVGLRDGWGTQFLVEPASLKRCAGGCWPQRRCLLVCQRFYAGELLTF